jgi:hypothetical protein
MSEAPPKLTQYISRLVTLTQEGKILWSRVSPTVYAWDSKTGVKHARVIIQEARIRTRSPAGGLTTLASYLLQIQGIHDDNVDVAIDSRERAEYQAPLEALFEAASQSMDSRTASLLENLLNDFDK